ncbi:unnamed protein product [Pelagomonas calceolata]|uniref:Subtilisin n=1 Tax=Pelagomonas calceolata TaxID=35677 RepID=A0A8J2SWS5_9STRA|nr:unnamed protein product [Pelagomonas calceolata]
MRTLLLLVTHALATTRVVVDDVTTTTLRVDARYVSSVLDPSSLDCGASRNQFSDPRGAGLANLTHTKLRTFVRSLAPTLVVITGGRSNCLDATTRKAWRSPYCQARGYGGVCDHVLNELDAFSTATGADVAWHVNPAFRDASGNFDVDAAPAPSSASTLLLYEELHEKPPRPSKQKLPVQASAASVAIDFASLRKRYNHHTIIGLLNQDTDQAPTWTDAVYRASKNSIDVVAFSYYASTVALGRAKKKYGCGAYADAAAGIVDPSHRPPFDRTLARYVDLARSLGKFVWVVAAAPCTHAPEGSGWGAVDAVAGGLWYADLLGRAATRRRPHGRLQYLSSTLGRWRGGDTSPYNAGGGRRAARRAADVGGRRLRPPRFADLRRDAVGGRGAGLRRAFRKRGVAGKRGDAAPPLNLRALRPRRRHRRVFGRQRRESHGVADAASPRRGARRPVARRRRPRGAGLRAVAARGARLERAPPHQAVLGDGRRRRPPRGAAGDV